MHIVILTYDTPRVIITEIDRDEIEELISAEKLDESEAIEELLSREFNLDEIERLTSEDVIPIINN